jgi:hypothetical protein
MAEVYPSDSDLLNITEDSETGVEYIPTGQAPYYLSFRKMLYRLLLTARRGSDLRVYSEGGLDVGVKAGKFFNGANLVSYAGSAGNTLADNKANIYLYLDSAGLLVTTEYSDWPDMSESPHLRLAIITTSGGEVTSISDARGHHVLCMPNKGQGFAKRLRPTAETIL